MISSRHRRIVRARVRSSGGVVLIGVPAVEVVQPSADLGGGGWVTGDGGAQPDQRLFAARRKRPTHH